MPTLPGKHDSAYWAALGAWARANSDGCTGVKDVYVRACHEHDFHYRFAHTFAGTPEALGEPISKTEADTRFRQVMQWESPLGRFSPLSWWRWAGVATFGRFFYHPSK